MSTKNTGFTQIKPAINPSDKRALISGDTSSKKNSNSSLHLIRRAILNKLWKAGGILEGKTPEEELLNLRTEYTKKFQRNDGKIDIIFGGPFHYKDIADAWQDINLNIKSLVDSKFKYGNDENTFKSRFAENIMGGVQIETTKNIRFGINLAMSSGKWHPALLNTSTIVVNQNIIKYNNIYNDVDIQYEVNTDKIERRISFKNNSIFSTVSGPYLCVSEEIQLPPSSQLVDSLGAITKNRITVGSVYVNIGGVTTYTILPSHISDNSHSGLSVAIKSEIVFLSSNRIKYTTNIPVDWLLSKNTVYPVVLDPDIYVGNTGGAYSSNYRYPFNTCRLQRVSQILFRQSDLNLAGLTGIITDVAFYNDVNNPMVNNNVSVSMKLVSYSDIAASPTGSNLETGLQQCYSASQLGFVVGAPTWKTLTLQTPFSYTDVTKSLLLETRFNNCGLAATSCPLQNTTTYGHAPGGQWGYLNGSYNGHRWAFSDDCSIPPSGNPALVTIEGNPSYGNYIPATKITINSCTAPYNGSISPTNPTVTSPSSINMTVTANGPTPFTYQWFWWNGSTWMALTNTSPYSGATSQTLNISPTATTMNGYYYTCVVSNSCSYENNIPPVQLTVNSSCTTPGAPSSLTLTNPSPCEIDLSWTQGSGTITGYTINYGDIGCSNLFLNTTCTGTSLAIPNLTPSTTYYFEVTSLNGSCKSATTSNCANISTANSYYSFNPLTSGTLSPTANSYSFQVSTSTGCPWTASSSNTSWLNTSSSGYGSAICYYTVAQNTLSTSRSASIFVNGQPFSVTQAGSGYQPTVNSITFTNDLENHAGITPQYTLYSGSAYATGTPIKICADGSTATYFKVNVSSTTGIDFRILDGLGNTISDAVKYGYISSPNVFGNNVEVAYTHPQYMDTSAPYRSLKLQVLYNGSPLGGINFPLNIYRAPVLFVHGLWGAKSSFEQMAWRFISQNLYPFLSPNADYSPLLYRIDYCNSNDYSFGHNSFVVPLGINKLLNNVRADNFSAGKVDIVAHSMGGLLSRIYMEEIPIYGTQYRNDVHKFITLNSPHSGSQWANVLWNQSLFQYHGISLCELITYKQTGILRCNDAIENLRVTSYDIDNLLNASSNLNKMVGIPTYAIATTGSSSTGGCLAQDIFNLAILSQYTVFDGENNDLIVALSSQYGGISPNDLFSNQCHTGSPKDDRVKDKTVQIINAIPNNSNFDIDGFTPPNLNSIYLKKPDSTITHKQNRSPGVMEISSPSSGIVVAPGTTQNVTITSNNVDTIHFTASTGSFVYSIDAVTTGFLNFSFSIPDSLAGNLYLGVIGTDTDGNIVLDTGYISVRPLASIDSIKITPSNYFIAVGETVPVEVVGYYNDGIKRSLTSLPGLSYQVVNTSFAQYIASRNIKGRTTGTTQFVVSYQGHNDTIPLEIYQGDSWMTIGIDKFCPGGTIDLKSDRNGGSYQWEINTGLGFTSVSNNAIYSGSTTNELFINNPPTSWYGYQYRCLVDGEYSEATTLRFSTSWSGSVDSQWENSSNWSCGVVPDGNTDVIINPKSNSPIINSDAVCRSLTTNPSTTVSVTPGFKITITGQ